MIRNLFYLIEFIFHPNNKWVNVDLTSDIKDGTNCLMQECQKNYVLCICNKMIFIARLKNAIAHKIRCIIYENDKARKM